MHLNLLNTFANLLILISCTNCNLYFLIKYQALMLTAIVVHLWIKWGGFETEQSVPNDVSNGYSIYFCHIGPWKNAFDVRKNNSLRCSSVINFLASLYSMYCTPILWILFCSIFPTNVQLKSVTYLYIAKYFNHLLQLSMLCFVAKYPSCTTFPSFIGATYRNFLFPCFTLHFP